MWCCNLIAYGKGAQAFFDPIGIWEKSEIVQMDYGYRIHSMFDTGLDVTGGRALLSRSGVGGVMSDYERVVARNMDANDIRTIEYSVLAALNLHHWTMNWIDGHGRGPWGVTALREAERDFRE
jgi:hypothetical protein